jgi:carboxymethylenebutenolidase
MLTLRTERIEMSVADGTTMGGYLCRPQGDAPRAAILLLQEIFGVNPHIRSVAERFAREGYVVLAPDLFHRIQPGYEAGYDDIGASIQLAMRYSAADGEADLRAAVSTLSRLSGVRADRIAALGFCMGGRLSFVANGVAPLRCAVSFYGNIAPDKLSYARTQSGPMMMIWAGKDAHISHESGRLAVDTLKGLGKPYVNVEFSEQNHGFFCDARSDYDAGAAAQAFALVTAFLSTHLR